MIAAQIRADAYGCISPGMPEKAAAMAVQMPMGYWSAEDHAANALRPSAERDNLWELPRY